ncbi:MAG: hypothetical protein ACU0A2_14705, partial [Cognatishimia sp.]|uniref:hypothetical protein n=1 Tax=Cognatishimia sp. TaxID=2211648 RepID=UPI004058A1CA
AGTGTYYHKFADLSIKVSDYGCSLVFRSEMSIDDTIAELAKGTAKTLKTGDLHFLIIWISHPMRRLLATADISELGHRDLKSDQLA